jgi:acyl carrier protein
MSDTLARLNEVFHDVFDDDSLVISRDSSAKNVEGWDSVTHVTLMMTIETAFGCRFNASEVTGLKDVGELVDLIAKKRTK